MYPLLNRIARELAVLARALANLIWPVDCVGCGAVDAALCSSCARSFAGPPFEAAPAAVPSLGVPVWGLSAYGGTAARVILAWKKHGRRDLSRPLGQALGSGVARVLAGSPGRGCVWLVPMPARRASVRARGADLTHELAQAAASALAAGSGDEVRAVRALRHVRRVRDQVGLDVAARAANLTGALDVRRALAGSLAGRSCVVVDDIVTTGASVAEMVRVLSMNGAHVVGVCCLSVTFRQQGVPEAPERTSLASWKAPSGPLTHAALLRDRASVAEGGVSAAT